LQCDLVEEASCRKNLTDNCVAVGFYERLLEPMSSPAIMGENRNERMTLSPEIVEEDAEFNIFTSVWGVLVQLMVQSSFWISKFAE
jgi:hypothetical protein